MSEFEQNFLAGIPLLQMHKHLPEIAMILLSLLLLYLAIKKKYEPFLLLPLGFGMLIANLPMPAILGLPGFSAHDEGGLLYYLYSGIKIGLYPPMIFLCLGAMTDFAPLIARPSSALIGLGGQFGIFASFGLALLLSNFLGGVIPGFEGFTIQEAAVIGIIGSSDGPTTIFTANRLAHEILPTVAIAAYSYMALVPIIQPPIMRLMTTAKERVIIMPEPKKITQRQKIFFPIVVTIVSILLVPAAGTLIAMLMLGNLIRESGVVERYIPTLQTTLLNILTILIGISIGATATAERMLQPKTIIVICLGLIAFAVGTMGGVLVAKIMCKLTGGKVNPLIGNAGVSAMPMAARVSQKLGQEYNPQNHLIMHAMGPIVASTLGSALVAGIFIALLGG
ncbi:MAG: sodium ion-translocating decarboxylase subunit beta [Treponema sp.]|jgi:oxaloacetate decarboxylase beta subunit|nr:sodium ion-translocating decarboxylase subunit beta [Treponema sp.]